MQRSPFAHGLPPRGREIFAHAPLRIELEEGVRLDYWLRVQTTWLKDAVKPFTERMFML